MGRTTGGIWVRFSFFRLNPYGDVRVESKSFRSSTICGPDLHAMANLTRLDALQKHAPRRFATPYFLVILSDAENFLQSDIV